MSIVLVLLAMSPCIVQPHNWSALFKKGIAIIAAGTVMAGIEMIADGNQEVSGSTVININSPKAGIVSDEHNT
jgi:hypothetical protein